VLPHRSQNRRLVCLGGPDAATGELVPVRIIGHASNVVSRVCRATLQAETYALSAGDEEAVRIRASIADARERLTFSRWEQTAAEFVRNVWKPHVLEVF
jgi:hypothetical protein